MANRLKMAEIQFILTLWERGWSQRRIARELGVNRETVSRYIRLARAGASKPANAHTGSDPPEVGPDPANAQRDLESSHDSNPANAHPGSGQLEDSLEERRDRVAAPAASGRQSGCEPMRAVIEEKLDQGLSAKRIHQDLVNEHGFEVSYYSVMRFAKRLGHRLELPFRRMESEPGEEVQVDFGTAAVIVTPEGNKRRPHVFRIVLSYSRKSYSEVVYRQTTENFIRCLENAFWHFGGVVKTVVIDNLKAAVPQADWYDPEIHPKLESFCRHYGIAILPTRPYTPRHKGKIERGIGYVKDNALKGRQFVSLEEQNQHLRNWEQTVADTRIHGTTRKQVNKLFNDVERDQLGNLPTERFPLFHEAERRVHRDGHIEVDKSYYSVPPEYLGRKVWARWNSRLVRIFNQKMEQIAIHAKQEIGRFRTAPKHIVREKIHAMERGTAHWLGKTEHIGSSARQWAESMLQARGVQGVRVLVGLLSLAKRHPSESINKACAVAVSYKAYRLRTIRQLIKRQADTQQQFEFIQEHPLIRSLSEYGAIVQRAFEKEQKR